MQGNVSLVRECIRKLSRRQKRVRGDGLDEKVSQKTGLSVISVRKAFRIMKGKGEIDSHSWTRDYSPLGMVNLQLCPPPLPEHCQLWLDAIASSSLLNASDRAALSDLGGCLLGMRESDMIRLIEGLVQLREQQSSFSGQAAFNVSAKFLLGSSKIIGSLNSNSLKKFGIELDLFSEPPKYLIVAGPAHPKAVIFVENPHAFESAVNAGLADSAAWIVTFGYGLSKQENDYGNQLSKMVDSRFQNVEYLTRAGSPPQINTLLEHSNLIFWGDLDLEGLRIYLSLKSKMPALQLSGLYKPMIDALNDENGHPYVAAVGKSNQKKWSSDEPSLKKLLSLCSNASIDQEIVSVSDIKALYLSKLDLHNICL